MVFSPRVALLLGVACMAALAVLYPSATQTTELMYGRGNNWGGFLDSNGQGMPNHRPANALTKSDLALLKVAHDEELSENKEGELAKKHDMAALKDREVRRAKLKADEAIQKQQLASVPAPFKKHAVHMPNHLSGKDERLLSVAKHEMVKETKTAKQTKALDEKAEHIFEQQKKAAAAAKKAKLAAAKAHAAHAKHAGAVSKARKAAVGAEDYKTNWGGFLPSLHKQPGTTGLNPEALKLLKSATADQQHDTKLGNAARARDQSALKKLKGTMDINTGKVHEEASKEMRHIEQQSEIGLNRATAEDDSEDAHAWGHLRG